MGAKRFLCTQMILLLLLALTACGKGTSASDDALALQIRTEYLAMEACRGTMDLIADYGDRVYEYALEFSWQKDGETTLTITAPEELSGVTASIAKGETALVFDGVQLETGPLMPDGQAPIDCLPVMLNYIMSGYIAECGTETLEEAECLRVQYREPEAAQGSGPEAVLWFDKESHKLLRGELLSEGFTVLQATIQIEISEPEGSE